MSWKNRNRCLAAAGLCAAVLLWIVWGNSALTVTPHTITHPRIPAPFDGYRIAQVSDLHNASFGPDNRTLLDRLRETQPDLIVLTGDLVDAYRPDPEVSLSFARQAVSIAPTCYVTGNHEARLSDYASLRAGLKDAGVTVLDNQSVTLERGGASIRLIGLQDPAFLPGDALQPTLDGLCDPSGGYQILLAHRPEYLELYAACGVDLVFSGHAHGGQFRLPWVGGLFAPGQGLFPTYDGGVYARDNTTLIVSRGLGNSLFPFRVNNRPELVVAELRFAPSPSLCVSQYHPRKGVIG